jgi:iron complex outermembrane receptor protein
MVAAGAETMMKRRHRLSTLVLAAIPAVAAAQGPADDTIVVTARKVSERAVDVPMSVTTLSRTELDAANLRDIADIARVAPNVAVSGGIAGSLQGQVAVRGIATLVRNIGIESGLGAYIDGVYVGRPDALNQELLDIAQVEVLRGPQGTLYGRNTIAGVFNLASARPTDEPAASLRVDGGSRDLLRAQASVSGPVAGDVATGRVAIGYARRDGFYRHVSGGRDADAVDLFSWRGTLALAASDHVTVTLRADGLRDRGTPGFFSQTDLAAPIAPLPPRRIDNNRPNRLSRDVAGGSATVEALLGAATLTSITAFRHNEHRGDLDDDQRQIDLVAEDRFGDSTDLFSQELRIAAPVGDRIGLLAGLYAFDQRSRTRRALGLGAAMGVPGIPRLTTTGRVATTSYAAFATIDWRIASALTVSTGLRYTDEVRRARFVQDDRTGVFTLFGLPDIAYRGRAHDDDLSPTVSASLILAPRATAYLRVARGFKSAAFNVDLARADTGIQAAPERATAYEAGVKLAGTVLGGSIAAFHTDYDDLQVAQITGSGTALSNAARAGIDGFEAEAVLRPMPPLTLSGSVGYADARYDRFAGCAVPTSEGGGATDCAGNRLAGAPQVTARGSAELRVPAGGWTLIARTDADYQSSVYFEPTNSTRFRARARTLIGARLGVETPRWRATLWVENLTGETYQTYRDDRAALGILRTTAYGAPRTWGLTLAAGL